MLTSAQDSAHLKSVGCTSDMIQSLITVCMYMYELLNPVGVVRRHVHNIDV